MKERKRIIYFIHYTSDDPFSRYRYYLPASFLGAEGYTIKICPFFSSVQSKRWYREGKQRGLIFFAHLQRFFQLLFLEVNDIVYIQYPLLPRSSFRLEKWLLRKQKRVLIDWFYASCQHKKKSNGEKKNNEKFIRYLSSFDAVVTANVYSARQVLANAKAVTDIPACVLIKDYKSAQPARFPDVDKKPFRIGWLGTIETSSFVLIIKDCLLQLHELYNIQLVLIGFDKKLEKELQSMPFINYEKQPQKDIALLKSCHVGVLPLPAEAGINNNPLFEMIQYMACGLPVVASSTEGSIAISHGNDNLFARTTFEWYSCLAAMIQNQPFYQEVGKKNGEIAAINYSVETSQNAYLSLFQNITGE